MPSSSLVLRAGPSALKIIRERGLRAEDIDVIPAASGGAKWLAIAGLDRFVFGEFLAAPRTRPLHMIGSSIGSWRMACFAQQNPLAALARGHDAYTHEQSYSPKPKPREITEVTIRILELILGKNGVDEILSHPFAKLHVLTVECRGWAATDEKYKLGLSVAVSAAGNLISRRTLSAQMRRFVFHNAEQATPFVDLGDFPTTHRALTRENAQQVLLASGSIPILMEGVRIPGEANAIHRDGGIVDYHIDLDMKGGVRDGLILYPHFYPYVVPGWFDKSLPWRRASVRNFDRALLIAPSEEYVRSLPGSKIPDRQDFYDFTHTERISRWTKAREASEQLGDELRELIATGKVADRIQPW